MLAYSGVAHAGFLLTGLVAGAVAVPNLWFYLVAYTMVLVASFAVVAVVAPPPAATVRCVPERVEHPVALSRCRARPYAHRPGRHPGDLRFRRQVRHLRAAWGAGFQWLVILGLLASVAAFFFYLRVIVVMYFTAPVQVEAPGTATARPEVPAAVRWLAVVVVTVTLVLGVVPGPCSSCSPTAPPESARREGGMRTAFQAGGDEEIAPAGRGWVGAAGHGRSTGPRPGTDPRRR